MTNNIFKNAKFGDKFLTRNGRCAILISLSDIAVLAVELNNPPYIASLNLECDLNGNINNKYIPNSYDIVSRYQEPIDEKKLNELAYIECPYFSDDRVNQINDWCDGFKAGYRKALDE